MKISPFTPLCFDPRRSDGLESRYIQTWASGDSIFIEVIGDATEAAPIGLVRNARSGSTVQTIQWKVWRVNSAERLYYATLRGLTPGCYDVKIGNDACRAFRVTDNLGELRNTSLIQYRFKDNTQRDDVISRIANMPAFFSWRVPGGFKDGGWQFGVTNEQFATQREDLIELYAYDYVSKTFTLGGSVGVPVWYGEMLNRLLTCSYVYIEGERYVRADSEVPNINTLVDGLDSFVFTQLLRQVRYTEAAIENENLLALRSTNGQYYRAAGEIIRRT